MILKQINKTLALKYLNNDNNLFKDILDRFKEQYMHLNFSELNNDIFFEEIHKLKSLSKNIGAENLYQLSVEINDTKNREEENLLQEILIEVLNEINTIHIEEIVIQEKSTKSKEDLFKQILEAVIKNRPKKVEEPLSQLKQLNNLSLEEKDLIKELDKEIRRYNFKNIKNLLSNN